MYGKEKVSLKLALEPQVLEKSAQKHSGEQLFSCDVCHKAINNRVIC
jgi:hypothetical protein